MRPLFRIPTLENNRYETTFPGMIVKMPISIIEVDTMEEDPPPRCLDDAQAIEIARVMTKEIGDVLQLQELPAMASLYHEFDMVRATTGRRNRAPRRSSALSTYNTESIPIDFVMLGAMMCCGAISP